ncbi:TIGR04013 family B12-binding domain/radical SAM domain-containing protein [Candidatus Sumerlaeota bacterium]|nr:TIGR04013 family B12-binding domain/radical SAM domain-containing protein [Candidatus Sumerlaeota bacterium]
MNRTEQKVAVYLCGETINRYSLGALVSAIEKQKLSDRIEVHLCDFEQCVKKLNGCSEPEHKKVIFAFSILTCQWQRIKNIIQPKAQNKPANVLLIAGGAHPSGSPSEVLESGFDAVFLGEAETSFPIFLRDVLNQTSWRQTPGLAYRSADNKILHTAPPPPTNLDRCSATALSQNLLAPIEITRGCLYRCRYCQTPRIFPAPVRHRSLESILNEAEKLPHYINFISPNAFSYGSDKPGEINERAIVEMLTRLRERYPEKRLNFGIFPSEVRPDYVRPSIVRQIKPLITNRYITIGVQSASDKVLRTIGRQHTVADVERAIETLLAEGFNVLMDFIFGLPGEDEQAVKDTLRFLQLWLSPKVKMRSHLFTPLPGTPFANQPPGKLHPALHELLNHFAQQKIVTGWWK